MKVSLLKYKVSVSVWVKKMNSVYEVMFKFIQLKHMLHKHKVMLHNQTYFYNLRGSVGCQCHLIATTSIHSVLEQHKLTKEQWEERIQNWHEEHRGMLR